MIQDEAFSLYCNDYQNPVLGAFIFYIFSRTFQKETKDAASLYHLFCISPLVMNELFSKHIKKQKLAVSIIKDLDSDPLTIGGLQYEMDNYKEFSYLSIYMAEKIGLFSISSSGDILITHEEIQKLDVDLVFFKKAEKLGRLLAQLDIFDFMSLAGVLI